MAAIEYPSHRPYLKNNNTICSNKSASKGRINIKISSKNKSLVALLLQNPTKTPASKSKTHKLNNNFKHSADEAEADDRSKMGSDFGLKSDSEVMLAIGAGSDPTR